MDLLEQVKYLFIPHHSNNYRAKALRNQSFGIISVVFLLFQLGLSSVLLVKPQVLGYASQISPQRVIDLTNQERTKLGLSPVTLNTSLSEAAQRKAGDMFAFDYWAHVSPSGREPWDFFKEVGYNFVYAGENLARDFSSADAAVTAWMASPSHRENIVNPKYKEIGIAVVDGTLGGADTTLIVQLFGTRPGQKTVTEKQLVPAAIAKTNDTPQEEVPVKQPAPEQSKYPAVEGINDTSSLVKASGKESPVMNPFTLTQIFGFLSFAILAILFIADFLVIWKQKVFRLTGRPLAHAIFLLGMILVVLFVQRGAVI